MKPIDIWTTRGTLVALATFSALGLGCKNTENTAPSTGEQITSNPLESLEIVAVESDMWLLDFSGVIGEGHQFKLQYKPFGGNVENNRIPAVQQIRVGDTFFNGAPGKGRFKLEKIEYREEQTNKGPRQRRIAIVEDLSETKKGRTYEVKYQLNKDERSSAVQHDHTAVFRFDSDEGAENEFRVKENGTFSLPPGEENKPYKLVEVKMANSGTADQKATSVTIQYQVDGETKTREIPIPVPE